MTADWAVWLSIAGLACTCIAATGAKCLSAFSRRELEEICRTRGATNMLGPVLRGYRRAGLAAETIQAAGTALFVVAVILWIELRGPGDAVTPWTTWASVIGFGALALLAIELWLPTAIARLWAAPVVYHTWPLWHSIGWFLWPIVAVEPFVETVFRRLAGRLPEDETEESFGEEIRTIVTEGHREGLLEEDAREMIEGVIRLGDVDVSAIMTPRTDMISLPLSKTWDEVVAFAALAEHTRIPVFNKTRDDIVGILFVKDLLPELAKPPAERVQPWSRLMREAYFVPETKPVDVLLQEFQKNRQHMAVVLDEYGGVSGLVSLEDVLEEIVGEIADEYDEELVDGIRDLGGGQAEVLGRVHIDEINERLGLSLPEDGDFDTIGGLVFSELGHVPAVGEAAVCSNVRLTVVEASSRRIERVRVELLDPSRVGEHG